MTKYQRQVEVIASTRRGHSHHGEGRRSKIAVDVDLLGKRDCKEQAPAERKEKKSRGKHVVMKEAIIHVRIPLDLWRRRSSCCCNTCENSSVTRAGDDDSYDSTSSSDSNGDDYEHQYRGSMRKSPNTRGPSQVNRAEHRQPNEANYGYSQRDLQYPSRSQGSYPPHRPQQTQANYSQFQRDLSPTHQSQIPSQPQGGYSEHPSQFQGDFLPRGHEQSQGSYSQLPQNMAETQHGFAESQYAVRPASKYAVPRTDYARSDSTPYSMPPLSAQPQANLQSRDETNFCTTPIEAPAQRIPSLEFAKQIEHRQPGSQPSPPTSNDHSDLIHLKDQAMCVPNKRLVGKTGQGKKVLAQQRVLRKVFFMNMSPCDVADWLHHLPSGCLPDNVAYNRQLHDLEDAVLEKCIDGEGFDYLLQNEKLIDLGVKSVHSRSFVGKRIKIAWDTEFC
eukprot:GEMP01028454.1.p1 GENE.GEMP01028454.1~~GEMP01028454.1.p1  ORF type:complete len:446 (+),score=44.78 GEMP01028454.1:90-1427(+)